MFNTYGKVRLSDLFLPPTWGEEKTVRVSTGIIEGVGTLRKEIIRRTLVVIRG